jgi:ankyrin repeat protein
MISTSFSQRTPLHIAAIHAHAEVCKALISAKADPAARCRRDSQHRLLCSLVALFATHAPASSGGYTPLMEAIREKRREEEQAKECGFFNRVEAFSSVVACLSSAGAPL